MIQSSSIKSTSFYVFIMFEVVPYELFVISRFGLFEFSLHSDTLLNSPPILIIEPIAV